MKKPELDKKELRALIIATLFSILLHIIFLCDAQISVNYLTNTLYPSVFEKIGGFSVVYILPTVLMFILAPSEAIKKMFDSRLSGISFFYLYLIIIGSSVGILIMPLAAFVIGFDYNNYIIFK